MKIRTNLYIIAIIATLLSACNNDLKILAPYKDTTVVYGLLDQTDTVHYIRVNKAFEGTGNAYTMAKVYDSINYPYGTISVQLLDYNTNAVLVNTFNLDSITTIPLDAGIFSYPHQILYKTQSHIVLNTSDTYTLVIRNEKTGKTVTGSTALLQDLSVAPPFPSSSTLGISFSSNFPTRIQFNTTPNGRLYQMTLRFFYAEINTSTTDSTVKSVDWVFVPLTAPGLTGGSALEYDFTAAQFFTFLKGSLQANSFIRRRSVGFDVIFTTGSDDLNTYIQLSQPSLGINQDIPSYTDLKNGIGIFTSRHTQTFHKGVTQAIADSLVVEPATAALNFEVN